jgi:PAS domain S-box-containing protein
MRIDRTPDPGRTVARLQGERALEGEYLGTATRFERLADAVEDCAMFLLDGAGRVRTWNTGAERITGYASGEAVGEHVSVLYREEDVRSGVPDHELREAAAEGHISEEGWRVREDGSAFRADVTITALRDEGKLVGYATVVRDRTRRRRERELLEQREHLEDLVATISHDLRNPISVAQGHAELAAETGDLDRLESTTRALERATELLDYLAKLAEEGSRTTELEPVGLPEATEAAWRGVETDGATLEVAGSTTLVADRQRLRQLLENLFGNSVEHGSTSNRPSPDDSAERGGSDVTVRVGPLETERERGFFVADDGPGIPEAERTEVFEMGYTTDPEGTGFGLAICERIADAHGWSLDVTDAAGGGARLEVSDVETG